MQLRFEQQSYDKSTKILYKKGSVLMGLFLFCLIQFSSVNLFAQSAVAQRSISLEWEPVEEAVGYHVEITPINKDGTLGQVISRKTKKSMWEATIPMGKYQMRIRSYDSRLVPGEWSEPIDFVVRPKAVTLLEPQDLMVIDVPTKEEQDITFKWTESSGSTSYILNITSENSEFTFNESVSTLEKVVKLKPGLTYYWKVIPLVDETLPGDEPEKPHSFTIQDKSLDDQIKLQEVEEKLSNENGQEKSLLEEPDYKSNLYYFASYLITQMNYKGVDKTNGVANELKVLGGTGRLGLGYIKPDSRFGFFGVMDLSGFIIGSENFTFASAEAHAVYHKKFTKSELKVSGGLYIKELTALQGTVSGGYSGVGKVKNYGPHVGFEYWQALNKKLGWQINGRFYSALFGEGPHGENINTEVSYEFGVLGSYRINDNFKGYAGLKYRLDRSSYSAISSAQDNNSLANPGDINFVEITGSYLNFILEYRY